MKLSALNDHVYVCQGDVEPDNIMENAGFVVSDKGVLVIDTTRSLIDAAWIYKQIRMVTDRKIAYVVNTHFHSDHVFGNQIFGAPVIAHQSCQERMLSALASDWTPEGLAKLPWVQSNPERVEGLRVMLPEISFSDTLALDLGDQEIQIMNTGGHTSDSSLVYLPHDRVLFFGDLLFVGRYPVLTYGNLECWIAALERVQEMDVKVVVPGHGSVGSLEQVRQMKDYFLDLKGRVSSLAKEGLNREEIVSHSSFPRFAERTYDPNHRANIGIAYDQLVADAK